MLPDRIIKKIDFGLCWEWIAAIDSTGYGAVKWEGKKVNAHRLIWELLVGPIPTGLDIDHLCRNRSCVNPDHLEPVTRSENNKRGQVGRIKKAEIMFLTCLTCGIEFPRKKSQVNRGKRKGYQSKYCSRKCLHNREQISIL